MLRQVLLRSVTASRLLQGSSTLLPSGLARGFIPVSWRLEGLGLTSRNSSTAAASTAQIKELREKTGAPIKDCKEALAQAAADPAPGDVNSKAIEWLRRKGKATATKAAGRTASQGLVSLLVTSDHKQAVIVEVNSETDFASRSPDFQKLVSTITRSVLKAPKPETSPGVTSSGVSDSALLLSASHLANGPVVGAPNTTIATAITDLVTSMRENIQFRRAARMQATSAGGVVGVYVHSATGEPQTSPEGRVSAGTQGAIVVLEADQAASSQQLLETANKLAMHIVAMSPRYLTREAVPKIEADHELSVITEQVRAALKEKEEKDRADALRNNKAPPKSNPMAEQKSIEGRMRKWFEEIVLLDQNFILPDAAGKMKTVKGMLDGLSASLNDNVRIGGYVRFTVGEGVEVKPKMTFEEEVASKLKKAAS